MKTTRGRIRTTYLDREWNGTRRKWEGKPVGYRVVRGNVKADCVACAACGAAYAETWRAQRSGRRWVWVDRLGNIESAETREDALCDMERAVRKVDCVAEDCDEAKHAAA
jgi:ferredoxin